MTMRIYLIHPKTPENFWAMRGALDIVGRHKALMQNSALLTLIALTPDDVDVEYRYCDENIAPVDWAMACDLVAITGYTLQFERMGEISRRFRARGIPVAAGRRLCHHRPGGGRKNRRPSVHRRGGVHVAGVLEGLDPGPPRGRLPAGDVCRHDGLAAAGSLPDPLEGLPLLLPPDQPRLPQQLRLLRRDPCFREKIAEQIHRPHHGRGEERPGLGGGNGLFFRR